MQKTKAKKTYAQKRDFSKTPEPKPDKPAQNIDTKETLTTKTNDPLFTIQEHHASHLHWDLRLEVDSVMPSWALPKGPSLDPKIKRLAVQTEKHPLSYATFEGVIPQGEYGAGTVMVWDYGTYESTHKKDGKLVPMNQCLKDGHIELILHGKKLQGGFVLIKIKNNWLFFKKNDVFASKEDVTKTETKSVFSNRSIEQIAKQEPGKSFKGRT